MYACVEDHAPVVKVLLKHGADPLAKDMLHNEWNCLHFAIMQVYTIFFLYFFIEIGIHASLLFFVSRITWRRSAN